MAKSCEICARNPLRGNSRSHSNIATTKWQKLNIQRKKVEGVSTLICTRCIKSLAKKKSKITCSIA